jgi:hypothetical protein
MLTISKKLQEKIISAGKINTGESFNELCKLAHEEGHKYVIKASLFEVGLIVSFLAIKGDAVQIQNGNKTIEFHMDFVETGSAIGIHSDYVLGVLDDLPKGKIALIKVQPMIFIGGGFLALKHKNHDLGLLGVFGGGPALDLLSGGWGTLHHK